MPGYEYIPLSNVDDTEPSPPPPEPRCPLWLKRCLAVAGAVGATVIGVITWAAVAASGGGLHHYQRFLRQQLVRLCMGFKRLV